LLSLVSLQGGGLAYGTKEGRLRLLRTERVDPQQEPKPSPPGSASGAESPTAPPPPRGGPGGAGESDDSEEEGAGPAAEAGGMPGNMGEASGGLAPALAVLPVAE